MPLEDKLSRIDSLNAQFKAAQPLSKERFDELWKKFRLEWDYNSNHIEGNTLTYGETVLLLIFGKTEGNHEIREYEEMQAHDVAIKMIEEWAEDKNRDLTEADIRTLNKVILVKPFWKEAITNDGQATRREIKIGEYKEFPNSVRLKTGEIFHYAPPQETSRLMGELIEWYRKSKSLNSLILASELHYRFIRIHPFDDGNGRVARLLVNYVLMKNNYPPLIVKSRDKENYLTALQKADSGDLVAFNEYMAEQLIWSLEIANKAAKGESLEEPNDLDKEISIWKKHVTGNKIDALHRNDELVYELYENGIKELFEQFENKNRQFYDLFNEVKSGIYKNNVGYGDYNWLDKEMDKLRLQSHSSFIDPSDTASEKTIPDTFYSIDIQIFLLEYKHSEKKSFSTTSTLKIEFHPYTYKVIYANKVIEKNYGEFLSTDECNRIINDSIKAVFAEIKAKSGK